jgi:hypothetical protein
MEDHPSSAICDCLFNIFESTIRMWKQPEDALCRGDFSPQIMEFDPNSENYYVRQEGSQLINQMNH